MGLWLPNYYFYPILTATIFPIGLLCTYIVAVMLGHTVRNLPYISDTGTKAPESCIFAQFFNVGALLVGINAYIRFKQVERSTKDLGQKKLSWLNSFSLWIGWSSAFGISLVGNFQETQIIYVHLLGALIAFGVGSFYLWLQVVISFKLPSLTDITCLIYVRVVLAILSSVCFLVSVVTSRIAQSKFQGDDRLLWQPNDGGWTLHYVSVVNEWIAALAILLFILTFVEDFRNYGIELSQSKLVTSESLGERKSSAWDRV